MSSKGNVNDSGNKGFNTPWQKGVLTLLKQIQTNTGAISSIDYELRTITYKANTTGTGYTNGDIISRTDIINVVTGAIVSTLWFNESAGFAISAPPIGNLNPYTPASSVIISYAAPDNFISGKTASITGTSDVTVIAAHSPGIKSYITHILVTNGHASVGTYVNIKSGTTVIYTGYAASGGGGFSVTFPTPLVTAAATALNAANETTGSDVRVSASGYKGT